MGILLDDPNAQPNETGDGFYDSFQSSTSDLLVASGIISSGQVELTSLTQLSQLKEPLNNFVSFQDAYSSINYSSYSQTIGGSNVGSVSFSGGVESKKTRYELTIRI